MPRGWKTATGDGEEKEEKRTEKREKGENGWTRRWWKEDARASGAKRRAEDTGGEG